MKAHRSRMIALDLLILLLLATNVGVLVRQQLAGPTRVSNSAWERLSPTDRSRLAERYRALLRQHDGARVLRHGREFAGMPAQRQTALRALHAALQQTLAEASSARRRELLLVDPSARGYLIYEQMRATQPDLCLSLRKLMHGAAD